MRAHFVNATDRQDLKSTDPRRYWNFGTAGICALPRDCTVPTPQMARKSKLMQSLKGVGPATATACLAYLPELGSFTKGQVARIVGLAPIANDSGKASLPRHIAGGRAIMRQALYVAAVVAIAHNDRIKVYAKGLRQGGKPPKLVITAVLRKLVIILNAILRDGQTAHASKA